MTNNKYFSILTLTFVVSFMAGCSSTPVVKNDSAVNINQGQSGPAQANTSPAAANGNTNSATAAGGIETVYVDLTGSKCKLFKKGEEEAWSIQRCEGVGGYKMDVSDDDDRQSIDIIAPDGKKSELNFQKNVGSSFSSIGDKAEWRVTKKDGKVVPVAMIVRLNVSKGDSGKNDSFLVVSKISPERSCVTDVVKPIPNANEEARKLADVASSKPCRSN